MDSKWLRDLIALHAAKSFSRAAERRNITQSAFSRRIRVLEDWFGTALIQRDSVPLELTEAGDRLLSAAVSIIAQLDEVEGDIANRRDAQRELVRIAAQHSPATTILPALLQKLHAELPQLRTHVVSGNLIDCIDRLNSGGCDVAVCHTHHSVNLQIDKEKFELVYIGEDALVPVATPDAADRGNWALPGDHARPIPLLTYEKDSFLGLVLHQALNEQHMNVEIRHTDSYSEALKKGTLAGLGMAWLPRAMIEAELETRELVLIGNEDFIFTLDLTAIISRDASGTMPRAVCAHFRGLAAGR